MIEAQREILYIVLHCTATAQTATKEAILSYWQNIKKWVWPGYHYLVKTDGKFSRLAYEHQPTNGVYGYNQNSIHVCYIGGIDEKGRPMDNRTEAQKETLLFLVKWLKDKYPKAEILGHRDFPNVAKACPSFDARKEYQLIA